MPADFTSHKHPVLAVACPSCRSAVGAWCKRPSGHRANDFHLARKSAADQLFITQHGEAAAIAFDGASWRIIPHGRSASPDAAQH